jgi:hypothetical protein
MSKQVIVPTMGMQTEVTEYLINFSMKDIAGQPPKKIAARLVKSDEIYTEFVLQTLMSEYRGKLLEYIEVGKPVSLKFFKNVQLF